MLELLRHNQRGFKDGRVLSHVGFKAPCIWTHRVTVAFLLRRGTTDRLCSVVFMVVLFPRVRMDFYWPVCAMGPRGQDGAVLGL